MRAVLSGPRAFDYFNALMALVMSSDVKELSPLTMMLLKGMMFGADMFERIYIYYQLDWQLRSGSDCVIQTATN